MAKKPCSIDGKIVGFLNRINLSDGVICADCAKKIVDNPTTNTSSMKLLHHISVEQAKEFIDDPQKRDNYIAEQDRLETQSTVQKMKEQNAIDKEHEAKETNKPATKAPHCPKCGSTNLQIVGNHRKGFSVGKALVGGVLTAGTGVGVLAGFAGKKSKKIDMICMNCGKKFKY